MIVRTIAQLACLLRHVETVSPLAVGGKTVERRLHVLQLLSMKHASREKYDFGVGMKHMKMDKELIISGLEKRYVVCVERGVVSAEIYAYYIRVERRVIPDMVGIVEKRQECPQEALRNCGTYLCRNGPQY